MRSACENSGRGGETALSRTEKHQISPATGCRYPHQTARRHYFPADGYCHFDHEHYEDLLTTDNPSGHRYAERKVPPGLFGHGPAEGALENIRRLKEQVAAAASLPEPHGSFASLAKRYHAHPWLWWIAIATVIWWTIKKAVLHVR